MKVISSLKEMTLFSKKASAKGSSIGFVPTMGYLHEGHLSLVRRAKKECNVVVVSIFVNPSQFGPKEDLAKYPRDLKRDLALLRPLGVDVVFYPTAKSMYPFGSAAYVDIGGDLTKKLCGAFRPVLFKGVTTVVAKLFNIVLPSKAYFGQKDAQQCVVLEKMVRDLNFPLQVVTLPTIREKDGLAMSSRNSYLAPDERKDAGVIYKSLMLARQMIKKGVRNSKKIKSAMIKELKTVKHIELQYISIVNIETLEELKTVSGNILIALALKLGKTRLIDNIRLKL